MSIDTSKLNRYKPGYVHSNDGPGYISMLAREDGEYVRLDDVLASVEKTAPEPLAQGEARIQSESQCAQIVLDGMNGPRRCMFKPVRGDTLCKRHRASADKTGYMPSKVCASPQPAAEGQCPHESWDVVGGGRRCVDCRKWLGADIAEATPNPPQPSASASERAMEILKDEMGGFSTDDQNRIPLEYALRAIEQALTTAAAGGGYWKEEARRYAENADFWRNKAEGKPTQPTASAGIPGYGGVPIDMDDPEASA